MDRARVPDPPAEPPDPRAVLGANVAAARKQAGLTQEALGLKADLHPTEVNRLERGRRNPGLLTIVRVARGLEVAPAELLRGL